MVNIDKATQGFVINNNGEITPSVQGVAHEPVITASVTSINVNVSQNVWVLPEDKLIGVMTTAINNRTRERNYFKLYCSLLQNEISEDEFDKLIDEHPEEYVPEDFHECSPVEVALARYASEQIMDVSDLNDMAALFSISLDSILKRLCNLR